MTNFLIYKLKQFWIRRYTWRWCFDWWFRVMYPPSLMSYDVDSGENSFLQIAEKVKTKTQE